MADEIKRAVASPLDLLRALRHGAVDQLRPSAGEHMREYSKVQVPALLMMLRGTGRGSGSVYDRAKNYAGGYDWGVRQAENPELARGMGKSYQLLQYLKGESDLPDAEGDYAENLAGVEAALRDAQAGPPLGGHELLRHSIDWARRNPRQGFAAGGRVRMPVEGARFIDPQAERMRGISALEAMRGYVGAPSEASVMYPGAEEAYRSGELTGMAEMLIPGAAMAKGALGAALAGVIKPRGGNWLESGLLPVLQDLKRATYNRPEPLENENLVELFRQNEALNRWVEGPLTKYLKRDIGTEQDPVRRLFDEGVYHVPPESLMDYRDMADADLALKRQMLDQPREPLSSGGGRYWENLVDEMIVGGPASEYMTDVSPAWMQKDPTATVYHFGGPTWGRPFAESALGLNHITDELDNSLMGEAGGLPRKFWLTPEKIEQMGMEKAVRHVDAINKWRAEQKIAANQELANKALAVREYPDTPELPNPKGLRWVELRAPGGTNTAYLGAGKYEDPAANELAKQLKYEGDTMGHCVGGYCPDVLEGKSRIFSLRDAKGEPHVTVEVEPTDYVEGRMAEIRQIKGKQNLKPKDEYLPFVQDFVKNSPLGGWGYVDEIWNTGLRRSTDLWNENERRRIREAGVEIPDYVTGGEMKDINIRVWPDDTVYSSAPKWFAKGGIVHAPAGNWRRMDLGGTIGYLMEG